ncbi:unnamed protein product [Clonostachys rosea f. rosea IK726]|uniref:Succinate dehydrogenase cytochrome b subunit n=2 Tax=Bionectria ochroleuca TaxID=29856 RepID=A0A0B7KKE4_BIOOC|nr:unnamed protein product [Clonostachys rosea f. rosea IK726]
MLPTSTIRRPLLGLRSLPPSPPYRTVPSCCFPRSIAQQTAWLRSSSKSLAASAERGESTKYTQVPPATQHDILSKQRLNRPIAPHLGAYKIEQTFLGSSAWMRITGCTLTGAIYVFFASYLVAPVFGVGFDSSALVAAFALLSPAAQGAIKLSLAFPFTFHFFNGTKQLFYDAGKGFGKKAMTRAEIGVWASSIVASILIAFEL